MTGGQGNDYYLNAVRVVKELLAIGIKNTILARMTRKTYR